MKLDNFTKLVISGWIFIILCIIGFFLVLLNVNDLLWTLIGFLFLIVSIVLPISIISHILIDLIKGNKTMVNNFIKSFIKMTKSHMAKKYLIIFILSISAIFPLGIILTLKDNLPLQIIYSLEILSLLAQVSALFALLCYVILFMEVIFGDFKPKIDVEYYLEISKNDLIKKFNESLNQLIIKDDSIYKELTKKIEMNINIVILIAIIPTAVFSLFHLYFPVEINYIALEFSLFFIIIYRPCMLIEKYYKEKKKRFRFLTSEYEKYLNRYGPKFKKNKVFDKIQGKGMFMETRPVTDEHRQIESLLNYSKNIITRFWGIRFLMFDALYSIGICLVLFLAFSESATKFNGISVFFFSLVFILPGYITLLLFREQTVLTNSGVVYRAYC